MEKLVKTSNNINTNNDKILISLVLTRLLNNKIEIKNTKPVVKKRA